MSEIENKPLVSVRLMTFNHGEFIAEAIESCLKQKTDFNYEIVIGDDFSTDNTLTVCKSYAEKYSKVRVLNRHKGDEYWVNRQKNGRLENFFDILENCNGKYIALLDGDDYWTDPLKLQRQVDFLEENDEVIMSGHKTWRYFQNTGKKVVFGRETSGLLEENEMDGWRPFHTASIVFRKRALVYLHLDNRKTYQITSFDRYLILSLFCRGRVYYHADNMGVYRVNDTGISQRVDYSKLIKNDLFLYKWIKKVQGNKFSKRLYFQLKFFEFNKGLKYRPYSFFYFYMLLSSNWFSSKRNIPGYNLKYIRLLFRIQNKLHQFLYNTSN